MNRTNHPRRYAHFWQAHLANKVISRSNREHQPIDVYIDPATKELAMRTTTGVRTANRVPDNFRLVGRYDSPINGPAFIDDVMATLEAVPA